MSLHTRARQHRDSSRQLNDHSREAFPALVTKIASADLRSQQLGALFPDKLQNTHCDEFPGRSKLRAHHHALTGDSRAVIDTITGGPPKHHTQPDFEAAWGLRSARGPLSRVLIVTMTLPYQQSVCERGQAVLHPRWRSQSES